MHDLCVIIVSHNSRRWLAPAIESVRANSGSLDVDVVVVDNGTDGAGEHVSAEFPFVRTIRCENRGFGHANNRALETADARHVLFLNPDTEILEGTLSDEHAVRNQLRRAIHAGGRMAKTTLRYARRLWQVRGGMSWAPVP
jgi:hypothetical protein